VIAAGRGTASSGSSRRATTRVVAALPSTTTTSAPAPTTANVVLWGDSLAWESRDAFLAAFAGDTNVHVETRTLGGTAPCDWMHEMVPRAGHIDLAVLEFSGNSWTDCMRDPATGDFRRDGAL